MTKYFLPVAMLFISSMAKAQYNFTAIIKDSHTKETLAGATAIISNTGNGASAGTDGLLIINNISAGKQAITFSHVGYKNRVDTFMFPLAVNDTLEILLDEERAEMDEVVISSTRSTRSVQNIPSRVEFISGEELEEKGNMKPGDIRMLLNESTGIQTQQTSATSANASIRIQGLDGRYTQILKDGFPVYSGAASGLGLLQTAPLDLKQVEIIKGSASTLYGGGAIAGLVNLISKIPTPQRELRFIVNGTSAGGIDVSGFYAQKFKATGLTMFASHNSNAAYDPAGIDLSAIPKFDLYTFNPRLFAYFNNRLTLDIGINTSFENRTGGDMHFIKGDGDSTHSYYEKNKTQRLGAQLNLQYRVNDNSRLAVRGSYNNFNRIITIPGYTFNGLQNSSFTEISYLHTTRKSEWITGLNVWTDDFKEKNIDTIGPRNYTQTTAGVFVQNTWKANKVLSVETGLRGDYVIDYGFVMLPRLSALFKINNKLSSRIGGGLGYKQPTIFTEESERIQYKGVLPVNSHTNRLERSYGTNFDINYKTNITDGLTFSLNQLFFYTYLNHPLTLISVANDLYRFENISGHIDTRGTETNIKLGYSDFKLFIGYTYTDAVVHEGNIKRQNPLTSVHRLNNVLMYEAEDKWKIGLEAYYFSPQKLTDGTTGRSYWICGAMAEKLWGKFSLYINFENFTDVRQTKFGSIYTGSITNPVFKDIYAPLDGFVVNGGIKIKL